MKIVRRKLIVVTIGTYRVKITLPSRIAHKKIGDRTLDTK